MPVQQYFCPAWDFLCIFCAGFIFASAPVSETRSYSGFRAPSSSTKVLWCFLLALVCFLCLRLSPLFGCGQPCCGKYFSDPTPARELPFSESIKYILRLAVLPSGMVARVLFDYYRGYKAIGRVQRFLRGCLADGSLRVVYEGREYRTFTPERRHTLEEKMKLVAQLDKDSDLDIDGQVSYRWRVHDMRKKRPSDHELRELAENAINAAESHPVFIVLCTSSEKAVHKIEQYNLIAKEGYELKPASEFPFRKMRPRSGSILMFCYFAEYVYIWG